MGVVCAFATSHKRCADYLNVFTLVDTSKSVTPPEVMT